MEKEALRLFPDEYSGDGDVVPDLGRDDLDPRRRMPRVPSPDSYDPGERALAGMAAVGSAFASKAVPFVGNMVGRQIYRSSGPEWSLAPVRDVSTFAEATRQVAAGQVDKVRVGGLIDITSRVTGPLDSSPRPTWKSVVEWISKPEVSSQLKNEQDALAAWQKRPDKALNNRPKTPGYDRFARHAAPAQALDKIRDVADSFIQKHDLVNKGVKIDLRSGPLSSPGGGSFNLGTKKVVIPRISQEAVLHELGHAADYTSGKIGKLRRILEPIASKGAWIALPIALAAGDRIKEMIPGTIDDKTIEFMQDYAPEIMGATLAATQILPEARASQLALQHIKATQGSAAAKQAFKRLAPYFGTYVLGAIPAVVGMSLARKYMNSAREDKAELLNSVKGQLEELEKQGGLLDSALAGTISHAKDVAHVGRQLARGTFDLLDQPGTMGKIYRSAKTVGTSPEFVYGAMTSAVPAGLGALYMYGTPSGKEMRDRMHPAHQESFLGHGPRQMFLAKDKEESWREKHPLRFAGLVAAGAALSGGIISKFIADIGKAL